MNKILLSAAFIVCLAASCSKAEYISFSGQALGTFYNITYFDESERNLQHEIDSLLSRFNMSLSAYNPNSILSKVNNNIDTELDEYFTEVFEQAKYFWSITGGAFDISASPLFSAWGFGFGNRENITPQLIDSLKQFTGMDKINIVNGKTVKSDVRLSINANAIAKGYASDVVADFMRQKGISNFLIDIGGEIVVRGKNKRNDRWTIGIDKPYDGNYSPGSDIINTLQITDQAIATSGNYRQFYVENGKKYAHTIDPKTGYPVQHSLLSATVIADNCMSADAVATALMVMGMSKSYEFLKACPEYQAYLIYEEDGEYIDTMINFR